MGAVTLIIAVVALVVAIAAYYRTGGVAVLKKQVEDITNAGEAMVSKATDSLRDKTADVLGRAEEAVRRDEEVKEQAKTAPKKEPNE